MFFQPSLGSHDMGGRQPIQWGEQTQFSASWGAPHLGKPCPFRSTPPPIQMAKIFYPLPLFTSIWGSGQPLFIKGGGWTMWTHWVFFLMNMYKGIILFLRDIWSVDLYFFVFCLLLLFVILNFELQMAFSRSWLNSFLFENALWDSWLEQRILSSHWQYKFYAFSSQLCYVAAKLFQDEILAERNLVFRHVSGQDTN